MIAALRLGPAQCHAASEHVEKRVARLKNRVRITQTQVAARDPLAQKFGATGEHSKDAGGLLLVVIRRGSVEFFAFSLQRRNSRLELPRRWWRNSALGLNRAFPMRYFDQLGVPRLAA